MISHITGVLPLTFEGDILSGYLRGAYEAYGAEQAFLRFYRDEHGAVLSVMDGVATVRCGEGSREEIAVFLELLPEVSAVRTDAAMAKFLSDRWGSSYEVRPVMRCRVPLTATVETVSASPREVYPLLSRIFADFPPFEPWYLDTAYRIRHDCCRIQAVKNEEVVASAMTVAQWETGAVIGAVATAPEQRGKGYASACVSALAAQLQREEKCVFICPKNEAAQRLYERLGFAAEGTLCWIKRN